MGASMVNVPKPVAEFLCGKRIAVAGVSRESAKTANAVYRRRRAVRRHLEDIHGIMSVRPPDGRGR